MNRRSNSSRQSTRGLRGAVVEAWADCRHASRRIVELNSGSLGRRRP